MFALIGVLAFSFLSLNAEEMQVPATRRVDPQQGIISFHYMSGVSKTDFRAGGAATLNQTFSITTTGVYVFVQDIGFAGRNNSTSTGASTSVFINSSNVILDLGGKTLYNGSGVTTNSGSQQIGVEVAANKHNICIKNGNISGFEHTGIKVGKDCHDIRIQDITVTHCGQNGINFNGTADTSGTTQNMISNCLIENSMAGFSTGYSTSDGVGLRIANAFNILVSNSTFGRCDTGSLSADAIGVFVRSCTNVIFDSCNSSGNRGDNGYGFRMDDSGTSNISSACAFIKCTANGNWGRQTTGGAGYGFYTDGSNGCVWENCKANGNEGTQTGFGFYGNTVQYSKATNCWASNNKGGSKGSTTSHGAFGFYSNGGTGNVWECCTAVGQQSTSPDTDVMCVGFNLSSETSSLIRCSESRSNGANSSTPWGVGINLVDCLNCGIDNCKLMNNKSSTSNHGIGVRDNDGTSSSLITNCIMFNNGTGATMNNFHVSYTSPGELNITTTVDQGGMGSLLSVGPYQNLTINGSAS